MVFRGNAPAGSRKIRGYTSADLHFTANAVAREVVESGEATTQSTEQDRVYRRYSPAVVVTEGDVIATPGRGLPLGSQPTFVSRTPSLATVDAAGRVTRVGDGMAEIEITWGRLKKCVRLPVGRRSGQTTRQFVEFVAGSLARHLTDAVDGRIAGKTQAEANAAMPLFSTMDHAAGVYVRNPSCWLAGSAGLTSISPWNSIGANRRAGTAITPRHILFAEHYPLSAGATIRFVTLDNQTVTRTIAAVAPVGQPNSQDNYASDLMVGLLDSDLPASIGFCKLMPATLGRWVGSISSQPLLPAVGLNQAKHATIRDVSTSDANGFVMPNASQRAKFYTDLVGGDSGSPAFLIVNNALVLITVWTYGGGGSGPAMIQSCFTPSIADAIATLNASASPACNHAATTADLSGFPVYN